MSSRRTSPSLDSVTQYVLALAGTLSDHLVDPERVDGFCAGLLDLLDGLPGTLGTRGKALRRHTVERRELLPLLRAFAAAKQARRAVDFGDETVRAAELAGLPDVRAAERARYRVVLLDEYQDTGSAQVELLRGLFDGGHPVTAVGDPLQSIYGWRGASAGTLARFPQHFADEGVAARVFPLPTSWRNDREVLAVANEIAVPLRDEEPAVRLSARPGAPTGRVLVARTQTVEDEARWVADRLRAAWDALPPGNRTAAVLVRRRAQIPVLAAALQEAGLPVEVVGLGGLLTTPEVTDLVAVVRLLADRDANTAAARVLLGPRWRLSPADFAALGRRAAALADAGAPPAERARGSLIEALDDPGDERRYSREGYRRVRALGEELRRLRARVGEPLPELLSDVERAIGLDVEVATRERRGAGPGRVHLDRFLDEAARFADDADQSGLGPFLSYLAAAEQEEYGLEPGTVEVSAERVQVITVHGAKGLEWDVVAVPGLVDGVFPALPRSLAWTTTRQLLPTPLRGDRARLPRLAVEAATSCRELERELARFAELTVERHALEERRLAYVAVTRARSTLLLSGYAWDTTTKERPPSPFLLDARALCDADSWHDVEPGTPNPVTAATVEATWPLDPLGARRSAVDDGAALVADARRHTAAAPAGPARPPAAPRCRPGPACRRPGRGVGAGRRPAARRARRTARRRHRRRGTARAGVGVPARAAAPRPGRPRARSAPAAAVPARATGATRHPVPRLARGAMAAPVVAGHRRAARRRRRRRRGRRPAPPAGRVPR